MRQVLCLFGVLLTAAAISSATTYYVDSVNGNDSSNGTSTSTPWKTLAKVNATSFVAGDQILLRRGGVWNESLIVPSSGASAKPIVFSAYGSGNNPLLDEQGVRLHAVTIQNQSYVTVSNLQFQNTTNVTVMVQNGSYITLTYCTAKNSGGHVFGVSGVSPGVVIDHNTYSMDPSFIMYGSFAVVYSAVESATISNNIAILNGMARNAGIITLDVNNAQIYGNSIYHSAEAIGVKGYTRDVVGAQVHDNAVYDTRNTHNGDGEAIEFTGNTQVPYHVSGSVYRNFIQGGPYMVNGIGGVYSPNVQAYDNIVFGPAIDAAFHYSSNCPGTVLYNNVVYNVPWGMDIQSGSTATINNNIFSTVAYNPISVDVNHGASAVEDYNIFYNSGPNKNISNGSHSSTSDPLFVSATPQTPNDVKLKVGSPAIGSGLNLGTPYNWILDPRSSTMPYAIVDQNTLGSWERGAFAFLAGTGAPPTADSVTPNSGSGLSQSFNVQYSDGDGYTDLRSLNLLFNSSLNNVGACWVRYRVSGNKLYLQDDTGTQVIGPLIPGSTGSLQNSQCVLHGTGSSAIGSGNSMSLTLSITFSSTFAGSRSIYAYAEDNTTQSSGWQTLGTWDVP